MYTPHIHKISLIFNELLNVDTMRKNLKKILEIDFSSFNNVDDAVKAVQESLRGLSSEEAKLVLSHTDLLKSRQDDILSMFNQKVATETATVAQTKQIGVIEALKIKYQSLAASIGISTAALTGLIAGVAAIGIGIAVFSHFHDTAEETAEKVEDLLIDFNNLKTTAKQNERTLKGLSNEYKELAQGVNSLGKNVSLSEEEFSRYHDIVNQIADMSPELVSGWDAEGNAIINIKNNVDALTESYKNAQRVTRFTIRRFAICKEKIKTV